MEQKLDFSLPEKKDKKSCTQGLTILLLIAAVILSAAGLLVALKGKQAAAGIGGTLSSKQMQELAEKLASRGLYDRAAEALIAYAKDGNLSGDEKSRSFFRIAGWLAEAGRYNEAVEYYYRSEMFGKAVDEQQFNAKLKECFEKMGKFSALEREIAARTSMKGEKTESPVVAEIGTEKITAEQLDLMIEQQVDSQMTRFAASLSPEQIRGRKKEMLNRFAEPAMKQRFLEGWIGQEVLYRKAAEEGLIDKAEFKRQVQDVVRSLAAEQMINREVASKVAVTDTDAKTYYEAHKSEYVEPAQARISHILLNNEQTAAAVLKSLMDGEDFAAAAKQYSTDAETKDSGGTINVDVYKGDYVSGIGIAKDINEKIFAASGPGLIPEVFKTETGWEIVKVDSITQDKQKSFEDVKDTVFAQLRSEKSRDIQQAYIKSLMDKYDIVIHTSAFGQKEQDKKN